jgi:dipeptidyl aminopeptidase/acylaminoacyl peptidase
MRRLPLALALLVVTVPAIGAAPRVRQAPAPTAPAPTTAATLTAAQAIAVRRPGDLQWSPDGTRLLFTIDEPASGAERRTHIWLYDPRDQGVRQFTNSSKTERRPRWSPDGLRLAFLSDREGQSQIYLLNSAGGEAWALTKGKRAVQSFEWAPDGKSIAFLAPEAKTDDEEKKEKDQDDARVVDRDDRPAHLWTVDVASGETKRLIGPPWKFSELAWVPAGDRVIVIATDHPESDRLTERVFSVSIATPAMTELLAPVGPFSDLRVSPDGTSFGYAASRVDGPSPHDLFVASVADGHPRNITGTPIDRPVQDYQWRKDGSLLVSVEDGFRDAFWTIERSGRASRLPAPGMATSGLALDAAGHVWFAGQHMNRVSEVYEWDLSAAPTQRTTINEAFAKVPLLTPEFVRYTSFDGRSIEGALLAPGGRRPVTPMRTVVLIHGGPTSSWRDTYEAWGQMLASRGFAVFYPNVRGSTGYGHDFMTLNRGDWGGGDFKDVMAGVDWLEKERIADPEKLGIAGWSYGGYMASWAITQTNRFKAAVTGAGMSDLAMEFGTEDGPSYDEWFYGLPYEKPEGFRKSSPLTYITRAKTPTLILQGDDDVIDPLGQSAALYRALKRYGVECELVQYPREGHGLREEKHLTDRLTRIVGWFEKYLQ